MKFLIYCLLVSGATANMLDTESNAAALKVFYEDCHRYENDHLGTTVCGDDGHTYRNPIHLTCLNHKLAKNPPVKILAFGSCPGKYDKSGCPWSPFYEPVCGTDGNTYVNEERLICKSNKTAKGKIKLERRGECVIDDPCCRDEWMNPGPRVCGTNGLTYTSSRAVRCLVKFGSGAYSTSAALNNIDIRHEGGCSVQEVNELYPSRRSVCVLSRHHYEFNPVCGANNITFLNPFVFLCLSPFGEATYSGGECTCPDEDDCTKAIELDKKLEECKKEIALHEVCGYDGLTYRSKYHLFCAAKNNSFLTILHEGRCKKEDSPCVRVKYAEGTPVCGTDGITYSSPLALFCIARVRDPNLKYVHDGPCIRRKSSPFNLLSLEHNSST